MYGQGNYPPQYRHPPFQQSQHNPPPPFQQALPGPPPPPIPQNPPHPLHQAPPGLPPPPYQHAVSPAQQPTPSYMHPPPQPYLHPPPSIHGSSLMAPSYSQPGPTYPPHHVSQPMPPPPRMLPPPPPPHSQGQVLYRTPPPPPPGIQHVPTPPPPPPSSFVSITPAAFASFGQSPAGDACPPSLLPPPPPPPPPSSPPPLPPSPPPPTSPMAEFPIAVPEGPYPDSIELDTADASVAPDDNVPVDGDTVGKVGISENKDPIVKGEASGDLPLPPPKPAEEEVVRNIEVLCQFIVKVGLDFENLARTKEVGNPQFAFLFGGEPGSTAAIGHEYFQWMKRKCLSEMDSRTDQDQKSSRALKVDGYSQSGNLGDEVAAVSPAASDMDMEDDVSQPDVDKGFDELSKESAGEPISLGSEIHAVKEPFHAPRSTTEQLAPGVVVSSTLSYTGSAIFLHDGEDEKDSSFIEDVSPVSASPDAAECALENNVQGSVRMPTGDSSMVKVSPTPAGDRTEEALRVYVKDGSPFRLIQAYASDSEEEDKKDKTEDSNPVRASPTTAAGVSGLHQDKRSDSSLSFSPENVSVEEIRSKLQTDSNQLSPLTMPKEGESFGSSPHKATSPSVTCSSPVNSTKEVVDLGIHQQDDKKWDDRIGTCEPSQNNDILDADHRVGKHHLEDTKQDYAKFDVDEFGRLVRKGASDSDSDEMHLNERHVKRGRSQSQSRSPRESRWRRMSRSPRRRDERSRSRSWSPKRNRSKSPSAFRQTNVFARRDRDRPPECFNFNRGRCFRGASCRFLHRDFTRHVSRQQQYQDFPRDSENYDGHDAAPFSERDKTSVTEMDVEKRNDIPWEEAREEAKSIEMQACREQSEASARSIDAGDLGEKDALASVADDGLPTVKNDIRELQVTDQVSQEVTMHMEEPRQVEDATEAPNSNPIEEERTQPPLESSQPLPADSVAIQPSPAGDTQPSQMTSPTTISEPQNVTQYSHREGPLSHPLPSQTIQLTAFPNRLPPSQPYMGHAPVTQTYPNQSPITQSYSNYVPSNQPPNQYFPPQEFPTPSFSGTDVNFQPSEQVPPGPLGPPPPPHQFPPDNLSAQFASQHSRENLLPPATSYQSQPQTANIFPSHRPPMASDYHSQSAPSPNPGWSSIPPPPPSHVNPLPSRPAFPTMEFPPQQHQQNAMPPRYDFNPMMRPYPPGEMTRPLGGDFHQQPFHSVDSSHQPSFHMDEFKRRPLPMGNHHDHPFVRVDQFSRPPMPEGPQIMSDSQRDYHLQNQSFLREGVHIPLPGQGFASSSSFAQGGTMHLQSLPRESLPNRLHSFPGDRLDTRPFSREEFSTPAVRNLSYSHHPPPYGQQQPANSNFPSNLGTSGLVDPSLQRYPSSFTENKPPHLSGTGISRMSISSHYNPFASTFEQAPTSLKFSSSVPVLENDTNFSSKYDSSFNSGHVPVGGPGSKLTASPPNPMRPGEQFLPRAGVYSQESNTEVRPVALKQFVREPVAGDPYDPLFDSIEPSSNAPKKLDHVKEPNPVVSDAGTVSKLSSLHKSADVEENSRQKGGAGAEHKSEVDELGEVATDAEVGAVENVSPQPVDEKDWSPVLPIEMGNSAAGEIEIDQVRSPGKSKKSKDSRSMKLFKIALADFVKEVLKPSWRQGNMSKEAFKTIVKKTVDKVSGAMPSHQIPKSQAKINQYVESSQRKLTKLVMGYVDKYVKI